MKYIVNREVFIQRNISKKFEKTPYSGHNFPIYEEYSDGGSGKPMFHNNLGWNDSLLGRLINHIIRKMKVKLASVVQIPKLINRLNSEFDRIYTNGCLVETYDADIKYKMEVIKLEFYSFLFEVKNSVKSEKVSVIKSLVKNAIDKLKEAEELEDKDKMISELEKFLEFLENYKDDEKVVNSVEVEKSEAFSNKYDLLVSNLTYLSKIMQQYKSISLGGSSNSKQSSEKPVKPNVNVSNKSKVAAIVDSYQSFCENVISKEQSHALQAFKKLKIQCQNLDKTLKGSKDPIVSNVELSKIISNKDSDVYKNFIIKLFVSVVKNLSGKNKTFVAPVGKLYENWNLRIDKLTTSEFGSISDKISRFAHVALLFKNDEELYSQYNFDGVDFGKNLKGYVDTLSQIKSLKVDTSNSDNNSDVDSNDGNNSNGEEISKYFEENCKTVSEFEVDEKVIEELEVKLKNIKIKKGFVIDGFDPVIEILRIFNQAYKLYMTPIISKRSQNLDGSTAGPSPGTHFEYTDMGNEGPWRNNEIFDKWEDAVFDILGNRKYQVIFDKDTVLRVGDEMREGKGPKLRQFMTDLLDGSKLYKPGSEGKGSQAKLLDSYFDTIPDGTNVDSEPTGGTGTLEANGGMQGKINESSKKIEILKLNSPGPVYIDSPGTFFIIDGSDIDKNTKVQIFAHYIGNDRIAFIRSFNPWQKVLEPIQITKNELNNMINKPKAEGGNPYTIFYTNVKNFKDEVQLNKEMTIKYTTKEKYNESLSLNVKVNDIYKFCIKEEDLKLLDLSSSFEKDYKQKFQRLGVDVVFKPDSKNKIVKYTKP